MGLFSLTPGGMLGDFVGKVLVSPLLGTVLDGYKARLAAGNTTDKILADIATKELVIDQRQRELDAQMNVMEQGTWFTRYPRAIVQWSFSLYIFKVVVWDIILGLGSTPSLHDPLIANAFNLIIAMWFGGRTLEKITAIVKRK